MNNIKLFAAAAVAAFSAVLSANAQTLKMEPQKLGVTTYEASQAVNLVVVKPEIKLTNIDLSVLTVNTNGTEREVISCYPSDSRGDFNPEGEYLALGLARANGRGIGLSKAGAIYNDAYKVSVGIKPGKTLKVGKQKFTAIECSTEKGLVDFRSEADYFSKGQFTGKSTGKVGDETLTWAAYEPNSLKNDGVKNPLVIWVHGGGEGGTDVAITLLGNEVVALARPQIQNHFTSENGANGAYILSIQCPTAWMRVANGSSTHGDYPSLYSDVLKSCIDNYVAEHPDVDRNRIYLGGCSNGGYMTMNMLIRHPHFFAAAYPTCEAYADVNISDVQIKQLAEENIWIVQSYDDTTVDPKTHCIPTFQRLMKAGAKNVWMSMFENVQGVDNPGTKLMGHFSWANVFNDTVTMSQEQSDGDVKPSNNGGGSVAPQDHANLFEWMNAQSLPVQAPAPQMGGQRQGGNQRPGAGRYDEQGRARY
ncbi:MAG: prolyl oligopeptidase family serine peptidase [Bacteroidales bacterium]|nr:prolyl oligopeptidase family serine peptidase [Bacteroidales bacterium]